MIAEIIGAGLIMVALGAFIKACDSSWKEVFIGIAMIIVFLGGLLLLITGGIF
jgi:hypothetical protein